MTTHRVLTLLLAITCTCVFAENSSAQCNGYGGYGGIGYWDIGRLYQQLESQVPYFAAHPPVYYSYPVARPYGYSPFAYLPHVQTPEIIESVAPQEIVNPFVVPDETNSEKPEEDASASASNVVEPLLVINPYVIERETENVGPVLQTALAK